MAAFIISKATNRPSSSLILFHQCFARPRIACGGRPDERYTIMLSAITCGPPFSGGMLCPSSGAFGSSVPRSPRGLHPPSRGRGRS